MKTVKHKELLAKIEQLEEESKRLLEIIKDLENKCKEDAESLRRMEKIYRSHESAFKDVMARLNGMKT